MVFRNVEYRALREYEKLRAVTQAKRKEEKTGQANLFAGLGPSGKNTLIGIVVKQKREASQFLLDVLKASGGKMYFWELRNMLLEPFMLRETNVKDICKEMAERGRIEPTWKKRNKRASKPSRDDVITLID